MKPALVFLHGIGGAANGWPRQIAHFETSHTALGWNAPGFGGRAMGADFTFAGLARQFIADLDAFGIDKAAVVGHSFGGMVAQQVAKDFSPRLSHLVLIGTSPAFGNPQGDFQKQFVADRLQPLKHGQSMADVAAASVPAMIGEGADADGVAQAMACMSAVPPQSYRAAVELLVTFDLRGALSDIAVPTLLIVGEKDQQAPAGMMRRMAEKIPGAAFTQIAGAGHLLPFEQPAAFNAALEAFLAGRM